MIDVRTIPAIDYTKKTLDYSPFFIQIEPTTRCNLKCIMCGQNKLKQGDLSLENFKKILSQFKSTLNINIQGKGEPFLNKDLFEMIKFAATKSRYVTTLTNGTLLNNKSIIKEICQSGLSELGISFDSPFKKEFERIRWGASYDSILEGVRRLIDYQRSRNLKYPQLSLAICLFKSNIKNIPRYIDFANSFGFKNIFFQFLNTMDFYKSDYSRKLIDEMILNDYSINANFFNRCHAYAKSNRIKLIFSKYGIICFQPWGGIYINWEGHVSPCCKITDYVNPYFGNLIVEDLKKIWNSKAYQNLRAQISQEIEPDICRGCSCFLNTPFPHLSHEKRKNN